MTIRTSTVTLKTHRVVVASGSQVDPIATPTKPVHAAVVTDQGLLEVQTLCKGFRKSEVPLPSLHGDACMLDQPLLLQASIQNEYLRRYTAVLAASVQVTLHPGDAHEIVQCRDCRFIGHLPVIPDCDSVCQNMAGVKGFGHTWQGLGLTRPRPKGLKGLTSLACTPLGHP